MDDVGPFKPQLLLFFSYTFVWKRLFGLRTCLYLKLGLVILTVAFYGCAVTPSMPEREMGSCDPSIDKAVQSGDWTKALLAHQKLLARSPSDCRAMYHLGYIWGQLGDRRQEVHFYQKALECGYAPDDQLYFNLGMAKADLGDLGGALNVFEQAVTANPKSAENYFGLGLIYQAMVREDEAEHAWLKAVTMDQRHIDSHLALVRLYLEQSRWVEARSQLDAVQRVAPDNEEARRLREILHSRQALEY